MPVWRAHLAEQGVSQCDVELLKQRMSFPAHCQVGVDSECECFQRPLKRIDGSSARDKT